MLSFAQIFTMRTILICLTVLLFAACNNSKQGNESAGKGVSKHSNSFNNSVQAAMDSYYSLTEAFVNWDSAAVNTRAAELKLKLDSINFFGFVPDSVTAPVGILTAAKNNVQSMLANKSITDKRHDLDSFTENLYSLLDRVRYDDNKIYLNECPMAFNDTIPGHWLSKTDDIRNPYLGLHHPKYGKSMIECGSNISTIDFTSKK